MNIVRVDIVNILLMIISAAIAIALPFELFLISYAILGPLHYLTQIFWLHQRQYFISNKADRLILLGFSSFVSLFILFIAFWSSIKGSDLVQNYFHNPNDFEKELLLWPASLIFLTFISAFIAVFLKDWWFKLNFFIVALLLAFLFKGVGFFVVIFGVLLATLIHVWLFTGIFILSGAVKNKTISSYISFVVFLCCSGLCFLVSKDDYMVTYYAIEAVKNSSLGINEILFKIFDLPFEEQDIFFSDMGKKFQSFIAFAYTYHYLNWFSKVEIIKWNQVPRGFLIFSIIAWIISVGIYAYSYKIGFLVLLFLSMMHVFLEFPLNFRVIFDLKVKKGQSNS